MHNKEYLWDTQTPLGWNTQTPFGIITVTLPQHYHVIRLLSFDFVAMEVVFEIEKYPQKSPPELKVYHVAFHDVKWQLDYRLERIEHALKHISEINQILK
jgi:hypothetical protein